jgi:hypothetical protein
MGISIGAGVGVALGLAFGNLALGIAIGVSLGLAGGAILDQRERAAMPPAERGEADTDDRDPRWLRWLAIFGILLFLAIGIMVFVLVLRGPA